LSCRLCSPERVCEVPITSCCRQPWWPGFGGALGERFDGASALERDGLLKSQGQYRAKVYHLPGAAPVSPEQVFAAGVSSALEGSNSVPNKPSSGPNVSSPGPSGAKAGMEDGAASADTGSRRDATGCLLSPHLSAPIVDNLAALSSALRQELELRAALPRRRGRLNSDELVKTHRIRRAFSATPTHEMQAYRTEEAS
jgi:ATP-dependent DNA helicase RecG